MKIMLLELFNSFILQSTTVTWKGIRSKREKEKGKKKRWGRGWEQKWEKKMASTYNELCNL